LTPFPISANNPRMGRPSLNVKATVVRLSEDVRERIERLVGKNQMAAFIREAIDEELQRRQKADASQALSKKAPPKKKRVK
jgi:hypothetical protein